MWNKFCEGERTWTIIKKKQKQMYNHLSMNLVFELHLVDHHHHQRSQCGVTVKNYTINRQNRQKVES